VRDTQLTLRAVSADGIDLDSQTLMPPPVVLETGYVPELLSGRNTPGALLQVMGRSLAGEERQASEEDLREELGGTRMTINGRPIFPLYVSADRIVGRIPFELPAVALIRVTTANGFSEKLIVSNRPTEAEYDWSQAITGLAPKAR
jgi:hypothetical protein